MKIYGSNGKLILDVVVDDNSYRNRVIMGDHNLILYFALAEHVEIPVGAYCDYQNERFTLERPEALKMRHSRNFEYTVTMEGAEAKAKIWMFRNPVDGRLKFPLTAKPIEHLQMFVDNMNRRDTGWSVGECIEGTETLISYDHVKCYEALNLMAQEFNTEFEFNGKKVSLRKVEYNKSNPLPLSYGKGNGFKPDLGRSNSSDTPPVEILFTQGGDRNIDLSKYGSSELHMPKLQSIGYDGEHFSDEDGFNADNARYYVVDDLGLSIRRLNGTLTNCAEDSLDCSDIYPKRVGTVSKVVTVNADKNLYDIVDAGIPDDLDYSACQIEGETMTIVFQSGMLAGREFDVKYYHEAVSGKDARRFEIVPAEIDGVTMPSSAFPVKVEDTYAVFNCMLPDAYICDNATKSGAEWDMFRTAVKYMFDNEEQKFTFKGELDGIWAKKDWVNIGGRIVLGGYVLFSDEHFQKEGVLVRITGIKDYVNNPHSPVIELSNETVSASFSSEIDKLSSTEVLVEENHRDALNFTKRRWRDAKETMDMLQAALLENFTDSISPITVQTMQLLVGDESLQFRFVNGATAPVQAVQYNITYDNDAKVLTCPAGVIQHMTLGITDVSSSHDISEYHFWSVPEYNSAVLTDGTKKYYLYAKCSKTEQTGEFVLSEAAIKMEGVSGYYHLLVGILNSESDGERSFVPLYGFTEVLPGRITTERIVDGSGNSYFDMLNNAMKLGSALDFNSKGDGNLRLRGTIVQSLGGDDESPIDCYRGTWQEDVVYYNGDSVSYTTDGYTATYRYINAEPSKGHKPTETDYWQITASGKSGSNGSRIVNAFCVLADGKTPETPLEAALPPTGWSLTPPERSDGYNLWLTQCTISGDGTFSAWSTPVRISGDKGQTGADGTDIEFVYKRSNDLPTDTDTPATSQTDDYIPSGWTDNPQGVSLTYKYEWVAVRTKTDGVWSAYSTPVVWSAYGETGMDGDGFEYIFARSTTEDAPTLTDSDWTDSDGTQHLRANDEFLPDGWTDDPVGVDSTNKYEFVAVRKKSLGTWGAFSTPALWAKYAEDGTSVKILGTAYAHYATETAWESEKATNKPLVLIDSREVSSTDDDGNTTTETKYNVIRQYGRPRAGAAIGWMTKYAEIGDGYIMNETGHLWVASDEGWNDVGQIKGDKGDDGSAGNYTEFRYAVNGSTTSAPSLNTSALNPSGWTTAMPTVGSLQYLWFTSAQKSGDGTKLITSWTKPVRVTPYDGQDGEDGADGQDGTDGSEGRGITSVTEFYQVNDNAYTAPTSWLTTIPTMTPENKYLWNFERVYYSKGTSYEDTTPVVIGAYGDDGRGIVSVTEMYLATSAASGVTKNTVGWSSSVQSVSKSKPYLYNYEIIRYTDNSTVETDITLIGHWGADGTDGTSINVKGIAKGYFASLAAYNSAIKATGQKYLVTNGGKAYVYTPSASGVAIAVAATGDAYLVDSTGYLYVAGSTGWVNMGQVRGNDGDNVEFIFQRTTTEDAPTLDTTTKTATDSYVPDGWTDNPTGVDEDYQYEWFSMRRKTDGAWGAFSAPALWAVYSLNTNPNLLEHTEFESTDKLFKWDAKSSYSAVSGSYDDEVATHIHTQGKDGYHCYYDSTVRTRAEVYYKEILRQIVYNPNNSGSTKLRASTWYTLSFWLRSGSNGMSVDTTSNSYGFARCDVYLEKGYTYRLSVSGYINSAAATAGRPLKVFIFDSGWTWSKVLEFTNQTVQTKSVTFSDFPSTGAYIIMAYYGASSTDNTAKASNENATVIGYMLQKTSGSVVTYCFPSAIDTDEAQYVDGEERSSLPADGNVTWPLSPTGSTWVRHSFTFKTKATIPSAIQYILFRMLPAVSNDMATWCEICQPKLEEGKVSTAYLPSGSDLHGDGYEFRYAKNSSATIAPSLDTTASVPSGWSTSQPTLNTGEYLWWTCAKKRSDGTLIGTWSTPVRLTAKDGKDGVSAAAVYRGVYSATKTYYGNSTRVDIVKYNNTYYVARVDAPSGTSGFVGFAPTNTAYWNQFGGSFESVATSLLLAELANIAGFIFRNSRLESQKLADGTTTDGSTTKTPMVYLDGTNGIASFAGGKVVFNADGSVNIGNGKFTVDKNGNVSMNNVTMQNITANSGTFKGVINCSGGLIMPVVKVTAKSYNISKSTTLVISENTVADGLNDEHFTMLNFPASPNVGQVLTIVNNNTYREISMWGNGHRIIPSTGDTRWGTKTWEFGYYSILAPQRAKQFVFDGTYWYQINGYTGW